MSIIEYERRLAFFVLIDSEISCMFSTKILFAT